MRRAWAPDQQGGLDKSDLKILPDPADAVEGKTRGQGEIEKCLMEARIRPGTLRVTDGCKARKAANWDEIGCGHDSAAHSRAEGVSRRGQHANLIEAKRSSI